MQSRTARLARGAVTGAFATVVAAAMHVSAGGGAPSVLAIVVALVFATLLGVAITGRRPSFIRLSLSVASSQAAFHLGFSYLGTDAVVASTGPAHHANLAIVGTGAHGAHVDDPAMWVAHVVAGALTIAFLFLAERSLWTLLGAAARVATRAIRVPDLDLPQAPSRPRVTATAAPTLATLATASGISRRGPPAYAS